jgi:hypothetical protein
MGRSKQWRQAQDVWLALDGTDIKLLEQLDYYERTFGLAFPGRELLARKLRLSVSTISRHVTKLVGLGVLLVRRRKYRRRDGTFATQSNLYRILGLIGAKIRQLVRRLITDVARPRPIPKQEEKTELSNFSHIKDGEVKGILERWQGRGED